MQDAIFLQQIQDFFEMAAMIAVYSENGGHVKPGDGWIRFRLSRLEKGAPVETTIEAI